MGHFCESSQSLSIGNNDNIFRRVFVFLIILLGISRDSISNSSASSCIVQQFLIGKPVFFETVIIVVLTKCSRIKYEISDLIIDVSSDSLQIAVTLQVLIDVKYSHHVVLLSIDFSYTCPAHWNSVLVLLLGRCVIWWVWWRRGRFRIASSIWLEERVQFLLFCLFHFL